LAQARVQASAIAARLAQQYPENMKGIGARVVSLRDDVVGPVRPALLVLLGGVALVLLIACANVANLLLLRADGRRRDVAVRAALGASRLRLVREVLAESTLLSLLGGVAGLALAWWGVHALLAFVPSGLPRRDEIGVDSGVLLFTLVLSLSTGLLFGLVPVLDGMRASPGASLKEGVRATTGRRSLRRLLVVAEVAVAVVVATGASLLARSFAHLQAVDPGFETENVLSVDLSGLPQPPLQRLALMQQLYERLRAVPGVLAAGDVSRLPLGGGNNITSKLDIERRPLPPNEQPEIDFRRANAGYFETLRIPLVSGRMFNPSDAPGGEPVLLINRVLAERFFPGEEAVGQRVRLGGETLLTIIGVVGATRFASLADAPHPEAYLNTAQSPITSPQLVVRTRGDVQTSIADVRAVIRGLDPGLVIGRVAAMGELKRATLAGPRFNTLLFTLFALLALVLSTVGAWGVMAYTVTQRTREIGLRVSLGARPADVARMIVADGMKLAVAGIAAGGALALAGTRAMRGLLFEVSPTDAPTFLLAAMLLAATVLGAALASAWRAARVDPVRALRSEA
jgi:putative ABC transport system permease protein